VPEQPADMAGPENLTPNSTIVILTPDSPTAPLANSESIFLAGTTTTDWRSKFIRTLTENNGPRYGPLTVYDPMLRNWSEVIPVESATHSAFRRQVKWEMSCAEGADLIVFMFGLDTDGGSKVGSGAVSLLELGIACERARCKRDRAVLVCCEKGFWKEGHVRMVCERYQDDNVVLVEKLDEMDQWLLRGA
jgi:hypothetical protein